MKFNEKLIKLRKEKALSQEELGEKLNVTRQTVSKWELGQTTPDMDKLIEMAKLFNVTTDELLKETDEEQEQTIYTKENNNTSKKNTAIVVGLIILLLVIVGSITFLTVSKINAAKTGGGFIDKIINKSSNMIDNLENTFESKKSNILEKYNEQVNEMMEQANKIEESVKNKIEKGNNNQEI